MSCTAAWNQVAFRGRNDDGNETTATWKANQSTNWSQVRDTNFRVRFEIQETAACAGANKVWQLQYNLDGAGWNTVNGSSNVVRSFASPNLADAANLTDQLTAGTGTFIGATGFDEVNGAAGGNSMDVAASGHAEAEFCVQILSASASAGSVVQLRVTDNGTAFASYSATPSITVDSGNVTVSCGVGALTLTGVAPTATATDHQTASPGVGALTLTGLAPTVTASDNQSVTAGVGALTLAGLAPTVSVSDNQTATAGLGALTLTGLAPTVSVSDNQTVSAGLGALTLSGLAPTISVSDNITASAGLGALTLTGFAPTISVDPVLGDTSVTAGLGELVLAGYAPTVTATEREAPRQFAGGGISRGRGMYPKDFFKIKQKDDGPRARLIAKIKAQTERDMRDMAGF